MMANLNTNLLTLKNVGTAVNYSSIFTTLASDGFYYKKLLLQLMEQQTF
jgi:hypothetical protein